MKITNECRDLLNEILKENGVDTLEISLEEAEDHSVAINMAVIDSKEATRIIEVNGIKVSIDEETENTLEGATFGANEGEITITLDHCCCGHDHGEHECCHEEGEEHECCGHHHEHEGNCCCEGEEEHCCSED